MSARSSTVRVTSSARAVDDELAARAAWLHYAGGLTQSAVAARLGLPTTRAHRLIARAARDGLVRVFVDCEVASCIELEDRLRNRFGLTLCDVVPDIGDEGPLPLAALAQGGSRYLARVLESGEHATIGVGHGRTLAAVVDALPRHAFERPVGAGARARAEGEGRESDEAGARAHDLTRSWVSLLGGLTRRFSANPYDVIFRLAEKTGREAYLLPAPMFVDSVADRATMLGQAGLREIMRRIDEATLCVLGIGATDAIGTLALGTDGEEGDGQRTLRSLGAVAELLGQFLDAEGRLVSTPWDGRMMAPALDSLAGRDVVAVAGGRHKRAAIAAALASGYLSGLITDESTARALVEIDSAATAHRDGKDHAAETRNRNAPMRRNGRGKGRSGGELPSEVR